MKISIVVPVYNEGRAIRRTSAAIAQVMDTSLPGCEFEIVFVDDGSQDDSFLHLTALAAEFPYVRVLRLAHNCGSHLAILAGMQHARGDLAVFLACDLQDPPEVIPRLLEAFTGPVQIVWGVRRSREDSLADRFFSRCFYSLARLLVSRNLAPTGSSIWLVGPEALRQLRMVSGSRIVLDGELATMDFAQAQVPYDRVARRTGKSKWTLRKKIGAVIDLVAGYAFAVRRHRTRGEPGYLVAETLNDDAPMGRVLSETRDNVP